MIFKNIIGFILLLLSRFSRVRLCATPQKAAHQAPPSLGFSRQEQWSGFLFPSPMHESEKWKWSRSVLSDSSWPHGLQPTRLLCPWDFPSKSTGVGCHCLLRTEPIDTPKPTPGHCTALQRGEIQFHPPEHRHKLHQPGKTSQDTNPTPSTGADSTTKSYDLENPFFSCFIFFSFSFFLSSSYKSQFIPPTYLHLTLAFIGAVEFSSLFFLLLKKNHFKSLSSYKSHCLLPNIFPS